MNKEALEAKHREWEDFASYIKSLQKGGRRVLRRMPDSEFSGLISSYQALLSDLGRARSMNAPRATVRFLNQLCVASHNVIYAYSQNQQPISGANIFSGFARSVRKAKNFVIFSSLMFWIPAIVAFFAVELVPGVAFDLVAPGFYDFTPTSAQHMHEIPSLARPLSATSILTNNIQVTIFAFAFGLTAGLGTSYILVFNGVHIGAVAGWLFHRGQQWALVGWILPHGSTEILAICLSGAAGYLLANALINPGLETRVQALQNAAKEALKIELGCMVMLVFAGLIEGFVSPSSLGLAARISILLASLGWWSWYFFKAGIYSPTKP